ncbi:MAG: hypothetical protein ACKVT0_13690 [Planctomycetaceae bacterium]
MPQEIPPTEMPSALLHKSQDGNLMQDRQTLASAQDFPETHVRHSRYNAHRGMNLHWKMGGTGGLSASVNSPSTRYFTPGRIDAYS